MGINHYMDSYNYEIDEIVSYPYIHDLINNMCYFYQNSKKRSIKPPKRWLKLNSINAHLHSLNNKYNDFAYQKIYPIKMLFVGFV
jgi:hypothetical protein